MYEGALTSVKLGVGESVEFAVKVGVHQGSILSPLLFILVLEALSKKFRTRLPWELFYADDLALLAETEEELLEMIRRWKDGMEQKGLKVNIGKTKVMNCKVRQGQAENSGKFPCGICKKGVGRNSICCTKCKKWIQKKCSGIRGRLETVVGFQCTNCSQGLVAETISQKLYPIKLNGDSLECVDKFCYF